MLAGRVSLGGLAPVSAGGLTGPEAFGMRCASAFATNRSKPNIAIAGLNTWIDVLEVIVMRSLKVLQAKLRRNGRSIFRAHAPFNMSIAVLRCYFV